MGKEEPVFGLLFTFYVFGTSLSAEQTCMFNLVDIHIIILFSGLGEMLCKLILHALSTARQCQFPYSYAVLDFINVNILSFSLRHLIFPVLSNVHKCYKNNRMYALEVSENYVFC